MRDLLLSSLSVARRGCQATSGIAACSQLSVGANNGQHGAPAVSNPCSVQTDKSGRQLLLTERADCASLYKRMSRKSKIMKVPDCLPEERGKAIRHLGRMLQEVSRREGIHTKELRDALKQGTLVIFGNSARKNVAFTAVGRRVRTKVNATIGTSSDECDLKTQMCKMEAAIKAGADTLMDLSTGGNLRTIRRQILEKCSLPVGTVPIYRLAAECAAKGVRFESLPSEAFIHSIEEQIVEGIDFITIHPAIFLSDLELLKTSTRLTGIVSRGGSLIVSWMLANRKENPFRECFDKILALCKAADVVLSLGNGLRPGCIHDAFDPLHLKEYMNMRALVGRARKAGVQVIAEGPGHLRLDQIGTDLAFLKSVTDGIPLYYMGPIVTDIAPGYDHITSAIGAAIAAAAGADLLCYITPAEHLGLPDAEDVFQGVIAHRIAAHAGDLAKGIKRAEEWDNRMAEARYRLDWTRQMEIAIDRERFGRYRAARPTKTKSCSICANLCPMKKGWEILHRIPKDGGRC